MSNFKFVDRPTKTDLGLNARVVYEGEMSLQPLRELMKDFGAHGCVDDLDKIISILISIMHQPDGTTWNPEYLQDRLYAMNKFRMAFTKLERSKVQKGGELC